MVWKALLRLAGCMVICNLVQLHFDLLAGGYSRRFNIDTIG